MNAHFQTVTWMEDGDMTGWMFTIQDLRARLDAIRNLHSGKSEHLIGTVGTYWACSVCGYEAPCPTLRAANGEFE